MTKEQKLFLDAKQAGYMLTIIKDTATYWLGEWVEDRYSAVWVRNECDNQKRTEFTESEVREIIELCAG